MQPNIVQPHILLTFGTNIGRSRTLRINNANIEADDAEIRDAMLRIIASQTVVSQASGLINSRRRASLVETYVTPISVS